MPQRKQLTWTELRVGVFVLVGMFILALGIFYVTGAGILAPKYLLRTYLPEVEGLTVGAPVRLDGIEVGNVDAIRMAPRVPGKPIDPNRNIELVLRIDRRYLEDIRADSTAGLITEGLLGNRYVSIRRGFTGPPIPPQGEIPGREEAAIKQVVQRGADLVQNFSVLTQQVRDMIGGVQRGRGSLGKLLTDDELYNRWKGAGAALEDVAASTREGKGSLGKFVTSDEAYQKINSAAGRFDALLADVQAQKGTLGKLVYDPTLHENARQFFERGSSLLGDVRAGKGTFGKLATDESLYAKWRDAGANLESATAKLNQGQGTAGRIFTDPQFYDNMTGLTGDLRLLVGDFRQNPKKFLRVKFSVF